MLKVMFYSITVLLLAGCEKTNSVSLKNYNSEDGSYSVSAPGEPKAVIRTTAVPAGGQIEVRWQKFRTSNAFYTVGYNDHPEAFVKSMGSKMLEAAAKSMVETVNGKILNQTEKTVNGIPAKIIEYEVVKEKAGRAELQLYAYLVGSRVYITQTLFPPGTSDAEKEAGKKFHSSFKILE